MSSVFITRPVATLLLTIAVLLLGGIGYSQLPITALPNIEFPTIQVTTRYPGASPRVVESSVTAPLEHALGQISGLTTMSSVSAYGSSQITLRFDLARSIDLAAQDVQAAINASSGWVPTNQLPSPPIWRKINPAEAPVLVLAMTSDTVPIEEMSDLASVFVAQRLSQVLGVGAITIEGDQTRAVRIQVDPTRLASLGMSMDDVRRALVASSSDTPKGILDGKSQSFQLDDNGQIFFARDYRNVIVAYRNDAPVYLRDVGGAVDGLEDAEQAAWFDGRSAVILNVRKQPGANTIAVADAVRALLPQLREALPHDLALSVVTDRTTSIRLAIDELQFTLLLTVGLVVAVIFLFLRRAVATIIPSIALPVSLISTFGFMALLGYSIDTLSLMALTIASGFVVDDAIVMLENIVRYIEAGESSLAAALKGARQIGFTVISLTISLVAVLIPLLLMSGLIGRLFREFALTLAIAIGVSAVVSLTLTPMMCAVLLRPDPPGYRHSRFFQWCEAVFDGMAAMHRVGLDWVLRHRWATLASVIAATLLSAVLLAIVPKGFLPTEDTGLLAGVLDAAPDISFETMKEKQQAVVQTIRSDPAVRSVTSFVGIGPDNPGMNAGRMLIDIGLPEQRRDTAAAVATRLARVTNDMPGLALHFQVLQNFRLETQNSRTQYQYVLQGLDENELHLWADRLVAALARSPAFSDLSGDSLDGGIQGSIKIDRIAAARYGLTLQAVDQILYDHFGQRQINTIYGTLNQYHVILEALHSRLENPSVLDSIFVTPSASQVSASGSATDLSSAFLQRSMAVPMASFASLTKGPTVLALPHLGLFPSTTISFNLHPGVSLGTGVATLAAAQAALGMPTSITGRMIGATEEFEQSSRSIGPLIIAAVVAVYIVLGILYESFIHPLTILSTLPSAGVGALLALMSCGVELDVVALIGIILLIGIVKKNAIMMVDFAVAAERNEGLSPREAIRQAGLQRFRPIMMTTAAALLGAIPLALSTGTGAEMHRPLGIAIVGGLAVSQLITLYTTPVVYLLFSPLVKRAQPRREASES